MLAVTNENPETQADHDYRRDIDDAARALKEAVVQALPTLLLPVKYLFSLKHIDLGAVVAEINKQDWLGAATSIPNAVRHWVYFYAKAHELPLFVEEPGIVDDVQMRSVVERIWQEIEEDINHHFAKYGPQRLTPDGWMMVILEEEGEALSALYHGQWYEAQREVRQVIACWVRLYAEVLRQANGKAASEQHLYERQQ